MTQNRLVSIVVDPFIVVVSSLFDCDTDNSELASLTWLRLLALFSGKSAEKGWELWSVLPLL